MFRHNLLALDVGSKRVGAAYVRTDVRVPIALPTLHREAAEFWDQLSELVHKYQIGQVIIGLPRSLDGKETAQTAAVRLFADELIDRLSLSVMWQDEALTSRQAEELLRRQKPYAKEDIDALAACLILTDYLTAQEARPL